MIGLTALLLLTVLPQDITIQVTAKSGATPFVRDTYFDDKGTITFEISGAPTADMILTTQGKGVDLDFDDSKVTANEPIPANVDSSLVRALRLPEGTTKLTLTAHDSFVISIGGKRFFGIKNDKEPDKIIERLIPGSDGVALSTSLYPIEVVSVPEGTELFVTKGGSNAILKAGDVFESTSLISLRWIDGEPLESRSSSLDLRLLRQSKHEQVSIATPFEPDVAKVGLKVSLPFSNYSRFQTVQPSLIAYNAEGKTLKLGADDFVIQFESDERVLDSSPSTYKFETLGITRFKVSPSKKRKERLAKAGIESKVGFDVEQRDIQVSEVPDILVKPKATNKPALTGQIQEYVVEPSGHPAIVDPALGRVEVKVKLVRITKGRAEPSYGEQPTQFSVRALSSDPVEFQVISQIKIDGQTLESDTEVADSLVVLSVKDFKPVKLRLMPLDTTYVKMAYGDMIERLFYVYSVRVFNNLQDEGVLEQKSILVYSGSLETYVTLEAFYTEEELSHMQAKKPADQANGAAVPIESVKVGNKTLRGSWRDVTYELGGTTPNSAVAGFREVFPSTSRSGLSLVNAVLTKGSVDTVAIQAPQGYAIRSKPTVQVKSLKSDVTSQGVRYNLFQNDVDGPYYLSLHAVDHDHYRIMVHFDVTKLEKGEGQDKKKDDGKGQGSGGGVEDVVPEVRSLSSEMFLHVVTTNDNLRPYVYRPYKMEFVEGVHPVVQDHSHRTRIISGLDALGDFAGVFANIFGPASDETSRIIAGFETLFMPKIREVWPDRADLQRSNLMRDLMRPMEEIPYGGDVERVVLFPKGSLETIVSGRPARIKSVRTDEYIVTSAIIEMKNTTDTGGG